MDVINNRSIVHQLTVKDVFVSNAFLYIDQHTQHGFLFDPGAEAEKILHVIKSQGYHIEKIFITHGHFDHIGAVQKIRNELNIPVYMHELGREYMQNARMNLSALCNRHILVDDVHYVQSSETFELLANSEFKIKMTHIPGHAMGHAMYYNVQDKVAFVGDTIFKDQIGTTQYEGGNEHDLKQSLKLILSLPDDVVLYTGHSDKTTVGDEKKRLATKGHRK